MKTLIMGQGLHGIQNFKFKGKHYLAIFEGQGNGHHGSVLSSNNKMTKDEFEKQSGIALQFDNIESIIQTSQYLHAIGKKLQSEIVLKKGV